MVDIGVDVARLELGSVTDFQRSIHGKSPVQSFYTYEFVSYGFSAKYLEELVSSSVSGSTEYKANRKFDFLLKTYLAQDLPTLVVEQAYKDIVQICWTPNLGHNIIKAGHLTTDSDVITSIDSIWLDIKCQEGHE